MDPIAMVTALANMTSKVMDKLPDYDQKKKEHFHDLNTRLNAERKKQYPDRDDDLIMNLRDDLVSFCLAFNEEINK